MKNKIEQIGKLTENLLNQIDISDYRDSNGHDLKKNIDYMDLKNEIAEKPMNAFWIETDSNTLKTETDKTLTEIQDELHKNQAVVIGNILVKSVDVKSIQKVKE